MLWSDGVGGPPLGRTVLSIHAHRTTTIVFFDCFLRQQSTPYCVPMPSPAGLVIKCSAKCDFTSGCLACQELDAISQEIRMGEDIIQKAKTRRSTLLSRVNASSDIFTSKFPVEIICYIFEEYVKSHKMTQREYTNSSNNHRPRYFPAIHRSAPLRLGSICQKWRSIAWGHARLWNTLVIAISCPGHELGPAMVGEWLGRTGEQHLNIQMNECRPNRDATAPEVLGRLGMLENAKSIVQALNSVSSRWSNLDLSDCPLEVLSELDNSGCCSESILQHLSIGGFSRARQTTAVKLLRKSKHGHRPTHLNLLSGIRPTRFNIGWARLTHLYMENMSAKHFLRILQCATESAPALSHLSLCLLDFLSDFGATHQAYDIRHPAIEYLAILEERCDLDTAAELLRCLTFPALRTFRYKGNLLNDFPGEEWLNFLNRSSCAVETVEMVRPCIEDNDLKAVLGGMPSIRTLKLELTEDNRSTTFFRWLSQERMNVSPHLKKQFLPQLEQLHLIARAPRDWRTFIGIFADDPALVGLDFAPTRPKRHALQFAFEVQAGIHRGHLNLITLSQLATLWEKYQFFVVLRFDDEQIPSATPESILMESYNYASLSLPQPVDERYVKLRDQLTVMSSLSFE